MRRGDPIAPVPRGHSGGIHTYGNGRIHIHPHSASGAGKAANLARFFRNAGYLQNDGISLPTGQRYHNGDTFPGSSERGYLAVYEQGGLFEDDRRIRNPASYVPRDGRSGDAPADGDPPSCSA